MAASTIMPTPSARPEGHRVQREPAEVQEREGADDRDRDRRADDERGADVAEKDEDDDDDEHRSEQRRLAHVRDRLADEHRLVVEHRQRDARHLAVDPFDLRAHVVGDLDGVAARLLGDAHPDGGQAVHAQNGPPVLGRIDDSGDVLDVDRHAVLRHHDEVADVVQARELALAAKQESGVALVDFAERDVLVLPAQQVDDAIDRELKGGDLLTRQLDVDLTAEAALHRDRRDPGHAFQPQRQLALRDLPQRHGVVVAFDRQAHDGKRRRVELEDDRRVGVLGQRRADPVESAAHVVGRGIEVRAPGEVQAHDALALRGGRVELIETGDRADRLLNRTRDELLHLERPDALVVHADGDARKREIRHQVDRQPDERDAAEQDDDRADHEHRDRAVDGETWDAHAVGSCPRAVASINGGSGLRRVSADRPGRRPRRRR
jgi:hypothetical protein